MSLKKIAGATLGAVLGAGATNADGCGLKFWDEYEHGYVFVPYYRCGGDMHQHIPGHPPKPPHPEKPPKSPGGGGHHPPPPEFKAPPSHPTQQQQHHEQPQQHHPHNHVPTPEPNPFKNKHPYDINKFKEELHRQEFTPEEKKYHEEHPKHPEIQ
jgi:hypothetical protein